MKAIAEGLYERGESHVKRVRRRIPAAIRAAYRSNETHVLRTPGSTDLRGARARMRFELARIEAEFVAKREQLRVERASRATKRVAKLTDEQLKRFAQFWVREVLLNDDQRRQSGLDDTEFAELGGTSDVPTAGVGSDARPRRVQEHVPRAPWRYCAPQSRHWTID